MKVNKRAILRYLCYKGKKPLSSALKNKIDEFIKISLSLIKPQWEYKILPATEVINEIREIFIECEKIAFCICTIGNALEERVQEMIEEGNLKDATILDAIGSELVEKVAENANEIIKKTAMQIGYFTGKRKSPGYGKFYLYLQKEIFSILDHKKINVELNEMFMMKPRKSISFAVPLFREKK